MTEQHFYARNRTNIFRLDCECLKKEPSANLLKKQEEIMKELEHKKTTLSQLNILDKPFSGEEVKQSISF